MHYIAPERFDKRGRRPIPSPAVPGSYPPHCSRSCRSPYSRTAYSEAVWYQTTETFIRCLENAFRYFGGVTKTLNQRFNIAKNGIIRQPWKKSANHWMECVQIRTTQCVEFQACQKQRAIKAAD